MAGGLVPLDHQLPLRQCLVGFSLAVVILATLLLMLRLTILPSCLVTTCCENFGKPKRAQLASLHSRLKNDQ